MKKRKFNFSIRANIFISIISLTLLMLAVLWILQAIFFGSFYKVSKENDAKRASNLITENIGNENIAELINQVSIEYDLCVKVVDCYSYETSYDRCQISDCLIHKIVVDESLVKEWSKSVQNSSDESGIYIKIFNRDEIRDFEYNQEDYKGDVPKAESEYDSLLAMRIVTDANGASYLLILNSSLEPVHSTTNAIKVMFILISILLLLCAIIISFVLSKRISKPIVNMNKNAKRLARSDYDVKFLESGPLEIEELANTLNHTTKELGKLDRMQKELIANISHDLRTPLTMISGYSEVMRDIPGENTPENMQIIIDETARLTSLVNDLLNVSKLQAGTQTMNIQRMNLTRAVLNTVERYAHFKEHNDFIINFEYENEVYIDADEIRLLQVIYNLINNAINYTGRDRTVTVTQTVIDDIVRISVSDSGEGIKEEDLPLIWDRYYKVDKIHKRAVIGTGLGLSIVKNILLLHGSRFGVFSEVGLGSTFWFEFKLAPDENKNDYFM